MLEHVPPALVDMAVAEVSRVTRKLLVLKIAVRKEGVSTAQKHTNMDRASHNMSQIGHLHETVAHTSWWIARFKKAWLCASIWQLQDCRAGVRMLRLRVGGEPV